MWRRNNRVNADRQLHTLAELAELPADRLTPAELETIFAAAARPGNGEVQMRAAVLLSQLYPALAPGNPAFAQRTHTALLRDLRQPRLALAHPACRWLLTTHLRDENLAHIPWRSASEVASAAECFYGLFEAGLSADESHRRVRDLLKYAGLRFAEQGRWEEVFNVLSRVHVPVDMMDADLFKLRNAVVLYEQRRVQRMRRALFLCIVGVILCIVLVSPLLFMASENPYRFTHTMPALDFFEALYWSVITSATVGYGEIVPHTVYGRLLAIIDSLLGMTVMGIIAGLILSRVTLRRLP